MALIALDDVTETAHWLALDIDEMVCTVVDAPGGNEREGRIFLYGKHSDIMRAFEKAKHLGY